MSKNIIYTENTDVCGISVAVELVKDRRGGFKLNITPDANQLQSFVERHGGQETSHFEERLREHFLMRADALNREENGDFFKVAQAIVQSSAKGSPNPDSVAKFNEYVNRVVNQLTERYSEPADVFEPKAIDIDRVTAKSLLQLDWCTVGSNPAIICPVEPRVRSRGWRASIEERLRKGGIGNPVDVVDELIMVGGDVKSHSDGSLVAMIINPAILEEIAGMSLQQARNQKPSIQRGKTQQRM